MRDRPVDVDAHQAGGVGVLRGRAHRLALAGGAARTSDSTISSGIVTIADEDLLDVDRDAVDPEDRQDVGGPEDVVDALVAGAGQQQPDVLEHEAHADGRDQRGELGRVAQRFIGDALDA